MKKNFFFTLIKLITLVLYIVLNAWLIYFMLKDRLFPSFNVHNLIAAGAMFFFCIIFPTIGIVILFRFNSDGGRLIKGIVQVLLILALPVLYILGTFMTGEIVISRTDEIENYYMLDEEVALSLEQDNYNILLKEIPSDARNIQYEYVFFPTIDPQFSIMISWEYRDINAFQEMIAVSEKKYSYLDTRTEEGNQIILSKQRADKCYVFSYDKKEKRVWFHITKNMSS